MVKKNEEEEERKGKVGEETKRNPEQPQMESPVYGFSQNLTKCLLRSFKL